MIRGGCSSTRGNGSEAVDKISNAVLGLLSLLDLLLTLLKGYYFFLVLDPGSQVPDITFLRPLEFGQVSILEAYLNTFLTSAPQLARLELDHVGQRS